MKTLFVCLWRWHTLCSLQGTRLTYYTTKNCTMHMKFLFCIGVSSFLAINKKAKFEDLLETVGAQIRSPRYGPKVGKQQIKPCRHTWHTCRNPLSYPASLSPKKSARLLQTSKHVWICRSICMTHEVHPWLTSLPDDDRIPTIWAWATVPQATSWALSKHTQPSPPLPVSHNT